MSTRQNNKNKETRTTKKEQTRTHDKQHKKMRTIGRNNKQKQEQHT